MSRSQDAPGPARRRRALGVALGVAGFVAVNLACAGGGDKGAEVLGTSGLPEATQGAAYSHTLSSRHVVPPLTWSVTSGSLPPGLTLAAATGTISGVPTVAGTYAFTVQVADSTGRTDGASLSLTVRPPPPPPLVITTTSLPDGTAQLPYIGATIEATGGIPPYAWSVAAGTFPPGLALASTTGAISGTPTADDTFDFTLQVADSASPPATATKALSILIRPAGSLAITTTSLPGGTRGVAYSQTLAATGGVSPYTWSLASGATPAGVAAPTAAGVIAGTPTAAGTSNFTVQVADSATPSNTDTRALSITVAAAWMGNDVIPGWTLRAPSGSRADLRASGSFAAGQWTVMFTRRLTTDSATDDRDFSGLAGGTLYTFSVAVFDNAGGEDGTMTVQDPTPYTLGREGSGANLLAKNATPTGPTDVANWGAAWTKPAGAGIPGTATGSAATLRAAYDATYIYLLAVWNDATESDLKQSWVFAGGTWTRRSDKGTDTSWATIDADGSQWDEDRLAIWWDISVTGFAGGGCQQLCHAHRMGTHTLGEKADLWHWKAARTNPMGFADDQRLNDASFGGHNMAGRSDDTGTGIDTGNITGALPTSMADSDPGANATFLFTAPAGSQRAVAFANAGFNANAVIPGWTLRAPSGSRADLRASGSFASGKWTVMFTRRLTTDSVTDDLDFSGLAGGTLYTFSLCVLDNMGGANDATMTSQEPTPYTLGNAASVANLKANLAAAPPTTSPTDANWGAEFIKPAGAGIPGTATGSAVTLRAAYDATYIYLLAVWNDATETNLKESWVFDGTTWTQRSAKGGDNDWSIPDAAQYDEDRLGIWWDISVTGFAVDGCQKLCHTHRMGTHTLGEKADLWHWKAARTNPMGFADDQRLNDASFGGHNMAGRTDDPGTGIDTGNFTGALPTSMAVGDPNANATFLWSVPPGSRRAVSFVP